ncbi:MAG TPA: 4-hydroxy-tetrahydrodipicolinate reductase [Steroidobacteraceae bacterium]|nr:4-hydroxy-tetrahydrodipicolinate reductase [Steroidobacteraceae bacterium]
MSGAAASRGSAIRSVIVGASGRMGMQMLRLLPTFPRLKLVGAVASERSAALGEDAGAVAGARGVPISASLPPLLAGADLVIDFSRADAAAAHVAACVAARVPLLLGTSGLPAELAAPLAAAAEVIPLLVAPNTSPGVTLLLELVRQAAQALPRNYDIEIMEAHHRSKVDAPSGTALALGEAAAMGRGQALGEQAAYARYGHAGPRREGQIGFAALRGGDVVGEHEVWFLGDGERLLLKHSATDRSVFARGALLAGQWLAGRPPGRYGMRDVFINGYR